MSVAAAVSGSWLRHITKELLTAEPVVDSGFDSSWLEAAVVVVGARAVAHRVVVCDTGAVAVRACFVAGVADRV